MQIALTHRKNCGFNDEYIASSGVNLLYFSYGLSLVHSLVLRDRMTFRLTFKGRYLGSFGSLKKGEKITVIKMLGYIIRQNM